MKRFSRREFVRATGATAVATGLAGCGDDEAGQDEGHDTEAGDAHDEGHDDADSDGDTGDTGGEADDDGETDDTDGETNDTSSQTDDAEFVDEEPEYDGWFENVDNFEATYDFTDEDPVIVTVGPDGDFVFDPPAIQISSGTTVSWTWSGEGEDHSVVHRDGAFESELASEEEHTFEHTFEEPGTYKYECGQHGELDMRGAVVVE